MPRLTTAFLPQQLDSGYVIMPGWGGPADSSTDGDDDDPSLDYLDARPGVLPAPSGIVFEGEAVIINGRSNLQRQPKTKKVSPASGPWRPLDAPPAQAA